MAVVKNWIAEAAREIQDLASQNPVDGYIPIQAADAAAIIEKHTPLKEGVAYMEVPRCHSCKHSTPVRTNLRQDSKTQIYCTEITDAEGEDMIFDKAFGCILWTPK